VEHEELSKPEEETEEETRPDTGASSGYESGEPGTNTRQNSSGIPGQQIPGQESEVQGAGMYVCMYVCVCVCLCGKGKHGKLVCVC
jgi:hypothetical protein